MITKTSIRTTSRVTKPKKSLKAPVFFSIFIVVLVLTMLMFYTVLNEEEIRLMDLVAENDRKIKAFQQQHDQLKAQTNTLIETLSQEQSRYASLSAELKDALNVKPSTPKPSTPTTPVTTPEPTPVITPVTPTPASEPQPTPPPRRTRAS